MQALRRRIWFGGMLFAAAIVGACARYGMPSEAEMDALQASIAREMVATAEGRPRHYPTKFASSEPIIAGFNVRDYGAIGDGRIDDTRAFQEAFDAAGRVGGAVVFAPAARYLIEGRLTLPRGVTLRGEYDPARVNEGTLLLATGGRGSEAGPAFITMELCTGLVGLSIYYPEQEAGAPAAYPWTIEQTGVDSITVHDVTLVNPWQGVKIGPQPNELHFLRNVRMTALKTGVLIDATTDIGRLERVVISPGVWEKSGLLAGGLFSRNGALRRHLKTHADAIVMQRSDWQYFTDVAIDGYRNGLTLRDGPNGASNAQAFNVWISDCHTALNAVQTNYIGFAMTGSHLEAESGPGAAALRTAPDFTGILQLNGTRIACKAGEAAVVLEGDGVVSLLNCSLAAADCPSIEARAGHLTVEACAFSTTAPIHLAETMRSAILAGNGIPADLSGRAYERSARRWKDRFLANSEDSRLPKIVSGNPGFVIHGAFDWEEDRFVGDRVVKVPWPEFPRPGSSDVFVATAAPFSAPADGESDAAAAIQAALDAAGEKGGTVYLPAGRYRLEGPLTIPPGVELRGIWEVPHHTMGEGTVLMAVAGRGEAEGTPLLNLRPGAGLRGLTVYYPEQDFREPVAYPWAVRGQGHGVYALNVTLSNAWRGIDFGTHDCTGHVIDYAAGAPLRTGIFIGESKGGWVSNTQFNPHYYARSPYPGHPDEGRREWQVWWNQQKAQLDALLLAGADNQWLVNNFVYGSRHGLRFAEPQPAIPVAAGSSISGEVSVPERPRAQTVVIGHGSDGTAQGVRIEAVGARGLEFINFQAAVFAAREEAYIAVKPAAPDAVAGPIRFFNSLFWAAPKIGIDVAGGEVQVRQAHFVVPGETMARVAGDAGGTDPGGRLTLKSIYVQAPTERHVLLEEGAAGMRLTTGLVAGEFRLENRSGVEPEMGVVVERETTEGL